MIGTNVMYEMLEKVNYIRGKLQDEESKKIYDLRMNAFIYRDMEEFLDKIPSISTNWRLGEVDHIFSILNQIESIVICGAGRCGMRTYNILKNSSYKDFNIIFLDSSTKVRKDLEEKGFCTIDIVELMEDYRNSIAIISTPRYRQELYDQIVFAGFPQERILNPFGGNIVGVCGQ